MKQPKRGTKVAKNKKQVKKAVKKTTGSKKSQDGIAWTGRPKATSTPAYGQDRVMKDRKMQEARDADYRKRAQKKKSNSKKRK